MLGYAARRLMLAVPVMGVVALVVFSLLYFTPGDPALVMAGDQATPADVIRIRASLGLDQPAYIRFGRGELPPGTTLPAYAPWRRLAAGNGPVVAVAGPLAGPVMAALAGSGSVSPDIWVVSELPLSAAEPPPEFAARVAASGRLCVIEEHVGQGGLGQMLAVWALRTGIALRGFSHQHARGYPSGLYGSQAFHRRESMLDADSIRQTVLDLAQ